MKRVLTILSFVFILLSISFISATEPMNLRTIKEIKSVNPSDIANMGFGVHQVSAQYNIGGYSQGDWMPFSNKKCDDLIFGAVWIEVSWDRPETDIVLVDGLGIERKIYLPASNSDGDLAYPEFYWISEDGSSYYATENHGHGWADLEYDEALIPEHLARASSSPEQTNPDEEEPLECGVGDGNSITIKGQLVDQMNNQPIAGAQLSSAYEFSPAEVFTDPNGNFEFRVNKEYEWYGSFFANCYGWSGSIGLQPNDEYDLALIMGKFDAEEDIKRDVSGQTEVDTGEVYAVPSADISISSDIEASFNVMYKYKNREGYNGGGNSNYRKEHYSTAALPLDYDVHIEFEDEAGNTYKSTTTHTPKDAMCGIIYLKYFNGESEWSTLGGIEATEETGPISLPPELPDEIREDPTFLETICKDSCYANDKCYPFGYRKSDEFCSDNGAFTEQLESGNTCENSFECESNVCVDGECISSGFLRKIINWFKNFFS